MGGFGVNDWPSVSVVIPARDAAAILPATLDSILLQSYPGLMEVIVADGSRDTETADLLRARYPQVIRVDNPQGGISAGLNRAIAVARHSIVQRCDAHAVLRPGYIEKAVTTLHRTGAVNVGGRQHPVGRTLFERAVALATTTWLGTGGPSYRVGGSAGPVDTVYPGTFLRAALIAAGSFDEALQCNEDYEMNWRLRMQGGAVWFDPDLTTDYRPRGSFGALARQYYNYGRWKRVVLRRHPMSLKLRQLAAPLLLLSFVLSALLAVAGAFLVAVPPVPGAQAYGHGLLALAFLGPGTWVLALLGVSSAVGLRRRSGAALLMPAVIATIHCAWAVGFLGASSLATDIGMRPLRTDRADPSS